MAEQPLIVAPKFGHRNLAAKNLGLRPGQFVHVRGEMDMKGWPEGKTVYVVADQTGRDLDGSNTVEFRKLVLDIMRRFTNVQNVSI